MHSAVLAVAVGILVIAANATETEQPQKGRQYLMGSPPPLLA